MYPYSHSSSLNSASMIITKANYKLASLLLRIPPHLFPNPLITVTDAIQSSAATSAPLPESAPGSGYNTPIGNSQNGFWSTMEGRGISHRVRLWSLEWLSICVQELGRAAIGEQKAYVLVPLLNACFPLIGGKAKQCQEKRKEVKEKELMTDWHFGNISKQICQQR